MPWQKEPMKDAFTEAKSTACSSKLIRRSPNEATQSDENRAIII